MRKNAGITYEKAISSDTSSETNGGERASGTTDKCCILSAQQRRIQYNVQSLNQPEQTAKSLTW